ncbi:MAG: glycosyltransferase family 39 protein, partial [Opitutaceae bacterium]|nr:glycosyltransferase family 39 protein [Opitutaceae bacterium]
MSEAVTPPRPRRRDALALAVATVALTIAAAMVLFSTFMFYDDEGYVLHSLKDFAEGGGLYREVYTQYGPLPFVLYSALHAIGVPLTHLTGRLITLAAWAGTAVACAMLVGTVTRSVIARTAALAAAFVFLWVMASEPAHPGGLIVFATALLALLGYRAIEGGNNSRWAWLAGAGAAALLLTKINTGAFAAFSAAAWLLLHHGDERMRRAAPWLVGAAGVALPLALMRPLLGTEWVQIYALQFALAAVAVTLVLAASATGRTGWRDIWRGVAGAGLVAIVAIGAVVARGTGPGEFVEGFLLGPLRHPVNFNLRFLWPAGSAALAAGSLALCAAALVLRRNHAGPIDAAIALLRLLAAIALAIDLSLYPAVNPG